MMLYTLTREEVRKLLQQASDSTLDLYPYIDPPEGFEWKAIIQLEPHQEGNVSWTYRWVAEIKMDEEKK